MKHNNSESEVNSRVKIFSKFNNSVPVAVNQCVLLLFGGETDSSQTAIVARFSTVLGSASFANGRQNLSGINSCVLRALYE